MLLVLAVVAVLAHAGSHTCLCPNDDLNVYAVGQYECQDSNEDVIMDGDTEMSSIHGYTEADCTAGTWTPIHCGMLDHYVHTQNDDPSLTCEFSTNIWGHACCGPTAVTDPAMSMTPPTLAAGEGARMVQMYFESDCSGQEVMRMTDTIMLGECTEGDDDGNVIYEVATTSDCVTVNMKAYSTSDCTGTPASDMDYPSGECLDMGDGMYGMVQYMANIAECAGKTIDMSYTPPVCTGNCEQECISENWCKDGTYHPLSTAMVTCSISPTSGNTCGMMVGDEEAEYDDDSGMCQVTGLGPMMFSESDCTGAGGVLVPTDCATYVGLMGMMYSMGSMTCDVIMPGQPFDMAQMLDFMGCCSGSGELPTYTKADCLCKDGNMVKTAMAGPPCEKDDEPIPEADTEEKCDAAGGEFDKYYCGQANFFFHEMGSQMCEYGRAEMASKCCGNVKGDPEANKIPEMEDGEGARMVEMYGTADCSDEVISTMVDTTMLTECTDDGDGGFEKYLVSSDCTSVTVEHYTNSMCSGTATETETVVEGVCTQIPDDSLPSPMYVKAYFMAKVEECEGKAVPAGFAMEGDDGDSSAVFSLVFLVLAALVAF